VTVKACLATAFTAAGFRRSKDGYPEVTMVPMLRELPAAEKEPQPTMRWRVNPPMSRAIHEGATGDASRTREVGETSQTGEYPVGLRCRLPLAMKLVKPTFRAAFRRGRDQAWLCPLRQRKAAPWFWTFPDPVANSPREKKGDPGLVKPPPKKQKKTVVILVATTRTYDDKKFLAPPQCISHSGKQTFQGLSVVLTSASVGRNRGGGDETGPTLGWPSIQQDMFIEIKHPGRQRSGAYLRDGADVSGSKGPEGGKVKVIGDGSRKDVESGA